MAGAPRNTIEVIPSARRLIESLRDVGYDFVHAVADLVDNSIAAGASEVNIEMRFEGPESWVRVADNGCGMSGSAITEAMRFGCERDYAPDDLGRFGLGLKTASLSQCSRLSVASRTDPKARRIEARQWDLDHVVNTNRWEVINLRTSERPDELIAPLHKQTGTVVLWQLLDRVLGYKIPWGGHARSGFLRMADELDQHLGMVFHRFIAGEARKARRLRITINGTEVDSWDPFAREEAATVEYDGCQFELHTDDGAGLVGYAGYVLPHQNRFSSLQAFNRYAGPSKWNYQQGLYIYRADRMIQSGGWSYLRTSDEHTKLARVALDFLPDLDAAFKLNVSKARVILPAELKDQLSPRVDSLTKEARRAYSTGGRSASGRRGNTRDSGSTGGSGRTGTISGGDAPGTGGGTQTDSESSATSRSQMRQIGRAIEAAAVQAGETVALERIKQILKRDNPEEASEIGW